MFMNIGIEIVIAAEIGFHSLKGVNKVFWPMAQHQKDGPRNIGSSFGRLLPSLPGRTLPNAANHRLPLGEGKVCVCGGPPDVCQ